MSLLNQSIVNQNYIENENLVSTCMQSTFAFNQPYRGQGSLLEHQLDGLGMMIMGKLW